MLRKLFLFVSVSLFMLSVSAAPLFQAGPSVSYGRTSLESGEAERDLDSFLFGADLRINPLSHLSIDIPASLGFGSGWSFILSTVPTLNFNLPLAGIIDIAVGGGPMIDLVYSGDDDEWFTNGNPSGESGVLGGSKLTYRLAVTLNLGSVSAGVSAFVPCRRSFDSGSLDMLSPSFDETTFSAAVLFNF